MARLSDSTRFRAKAVQVPWATVAEQMRRALISHHMEPGPDSPLRDLEAIKLRSMDIHLTWVCGPALGVPRGPFMVWTRSPKDQLKRVDATVWGVRLPYVWWGGIEAGAVAVRCRPSDPTKPVAVFLFRNGDDAVHVVAAGSVQPTSPDPVTVTVRTSGATYARVYNGKDIEVAVDPLERIVNDDAWKPLELVGLPVDQPDAGFDYDTMDQGPVDHPMSPVDAAVHRLLRGGPPLGWWPLTEAGRAAPPWTAPEPSRLLKEVRADLFPQLPPMYAAAVREFQQAAVTSSRPVDPPQQDGAMSSATASADAGPWPMLNLPAQSDPFLNLATGFGASYSVERMHDRQIAVGWSDFLVTARYADLLPPERGGGEFAAYAPAAGPHLLVPTPTALIRELGGRLGPTSIDAPWRESVRLSWDRVPRSAAMSPVTESALARYPLVGGGAAQSLLPPRLSGGDRPFLVGPAAAEGETDHDRIALVDGGQEVPIGSGGRRVGYAVAVSDVHGVWSTWQDVAWLGDEPAPQPPRIVSLALDTAYAGSPSCPSTLDVQVAVDWVERTPTRVEIVAIHYPMAAATTPPPAGMGPWAATPAGCFRRDLGFDFAGDVPMPFGCDVDPLGPDGTDIVPAGPGQGDGGRRYAVSADVPLLDFSSTRRWGVQVWARSRLAVGASPTTWSPGPAAAPALAAAASPVPVAPLPPAPLPGVPLGSTPDAQGSSHVRVEWSLPAGADVRTGIVWECSETALRQRAGLPARAPDTDVPGARLAALWTAYDAMTSTQRRAAFRRLVELDGAVRSHDVTLPKGSSDIHLFAVTTMTTSGVESAWPEGGTPHAHLRPVMAPRLRSPGPPVVRPSIAMDGTVTIELYAASTIDVQRFGLYRTTSDEAARDVSTMGPAFADVVVTTVPGPADVDPVLGQPVWTATWTGTLPGRWDPWLIRAVAVPVDTVPVKAERGVPSPASDAVPLFVPPGPPELEPLVADTWGGDHRGVVVRTATTAPPRVLPSGVHRLDGAAVASVVEPVALPDMPVTPLTTPPGAAATEPVLEQGERVSGVSPLALWFTRPVAADDVEVSLRLVDPLGREVVRTVTVPGWVPPLAGVHVTIRDVFAIIGRGVVVGIDTNADASLNPPLVMAVAAAQRLRLPLRPFDLPLPVVPEGGTRRRGARLAPFEPDPLPAGLHGPGFRPILPRSLSGSFPLDEIPWNDGGFVRTAGIQVVRNRRPDATAPAYQAFIPLTGALRITVGIVAPDGSRVTDTANH